MKKKQFEKLFLQIESGHFSNGSVAIANCLENWKLCSLAIHKWSGKQDSFAHIFTTKEETIKIRDALTKVIHDMP